MSLPVCIDDLDLAITDLNRAMAKLASQRDFQWAYDVCTYTRFVHLNVWDSGAPRARVKKEIIPLLSQAKDQLEEFSKHCSRKSDMKRIKSYAANVDLRVCSLERYIRNLFPLSDFNDLRSLGKNNARGLRRAPATSR